MKIVAGESVDKQIVARLRADGHYILFVAELDRGVDDETVPSGSRQANAILLTADKDFGELVFRQRLHHSGVLFVPASLTPNLKAGRCIQRPRRGVQHGICSSFQARFDCVSHLGEST